MISRSKKKNQKKKREGKQDDEGGGGKVNGQPSREFGLSTGTERFTEYSTTQILCPYTIQIQLLEMSYNGIGLKTAKGSSTSGHIQQSLANNLKRNNTKNYLSRVTKKNSTSNSPKAVKDNELIRHLNKRELELRVSEYRDGLEEDDSLDDETIEEKCRQFRSKLAKQVEELKKHERLRSAYVSRKKRIPERNGCKEQGEIREDNE